MKRRRFSDSFKAGAITLVREQHRGVKQAAGELGVSESVLRRWLAADDVERGKAPGLTVVEKAEIRELKRENAVLRMERDILKKATAFVCHERV